MGVIKGCVAYMIYLLVEKCSFMISASAVTIFTITEGLI
jgi:hypothetical protein